MRDCEELYIDLKYADVPSSVMSTEDCVSWHSGPPNSLTASGQPLQKEQRDRQKHLRLEVLRRLHAGHETSVRALASMVMCLQAAFLTSAVCFDVPVVSPLFHT